MNSITLERSYESPINSEISLDLCYKIDQLRDKFIELYKNLHNQKLHKHKTHYNNKETIELFFKHCDIFPKNLDINKQSDYLAKLPKDKYDVFSAYTISKILNITVEVFREYSDIKSISNTIGSEIFKRNEKINTSENLKTAFTKYQECKNNQNTSIDKIIEDTKNEIEKNMLKKKSQARMHAAIQAKQAEKLAEKSKQARNAPEAIAQKEEKTQISKEQIRINKLNFKIASRIEGREGIKYKLGDKYENFINQFDALIKISLQGGDVDSKGKKIEDSRYSTLSLALTNAQAATAYIKQFLHENKQEGENSSTHKLRYFSYDKGDGEEKYLTNEDITDQIGELFLFKVELTKLLDKNT